MRAILLTLLVTACTDKPIAANVPKPNTGTAAGVGAAAAAAMTLMDPDGAARRQEENKPDEEKREQKSKGDVPPDVLDRLDSKQSGSEGTPARPSEAEEQAPDPYGLSKKKPAPAAKPKKEPTVFTPQK